jgi:hypothetical protein
VDCLLIGHSSWASKLEGYPVDFQPITIGNSVALAWRVTVLPGTKIGDGAVIGANSLVKETIPPRCLAVGFPARVMAKAPYFPRTLQPAEQAGFLREIIAEMITYLRGFGLACGDDGAVIEVRQRTRRWFFTTETAWRFAVRYEPGPVPQGVDAFVSLPPVTPAERAALGASGAMWIDLAAKERSDHGNDVGEEIAQYLKRYGIRLFRVK